MNNLRKEAVVIEKLNNANIQELKDIVEVWYSTSIVCHSFVSSEFWHSCKGLMLDIYLPNSEITVAKAEGEVVGFTSLVDNTLASIFVLPEFQGVGIGQQLLNYAFEARDKLNLNVYSKNKNAIEFYIKNGFVAGDESKDEHTGELEISMVWSA